MFNEEYKDIKNSENEAKFWRELKVNFDKLQEEEANRGNEVESVLRNLSLQDLVDIGILLGLEVSMQMESSDVLKILKESKDNIILLYLHSMIGKRGRYVAEYYRDICEDKATTYLEANTLVKLLHLYKINHVHLFEVTALSEWRTRASGVEFFIEGCVKENISKGLLDVEVQDKFCKHMKEKSSKDTDYKVTMHYENKQSQHVYVVYKMKNDTQLIGFDQTKRIKSVSSILIMIDQESDIIHLKGATPKEIDAIKKFVEEEYKCELEKCNQEVIDNYDVNKFKLAFKSLESLNQIGLEKFQILKIGFKKSLLNKTPELIIGDGKKDIWAGVIDANEIGIIDINSLDSVKALTICLDKIKKTIKVCNMEDGSIVYKLDDKGLAEKTVQEIGRKFKILFGIPLNKRLKNKLEVGRAGEVDMLLRSDRIDKEVLQDEDMLQALIKDKIINVETVRLAFCTMEDCSFEEVVKEDIENCPICTEAELQYKENMLVAVNKSKVVKYILNQFAVALGFSNTIFTKSKEKKLENIAEVYRFIFNQKEYKIVITDKILSKTRMQNLERQLIPTIVIYYGIDRQQAEMTCIESIPFLEFGMLYTNKDDLIRVEKIIKRTVKELDDSIHYHIVSAAKKGNQSLSDLVEGRTVLDKKVYTSTDFEDDVYAILKHLVFASDKWGATETGKALPEGVLTFEYRAVKTMKDEKKAFSYDCKINYDGEGYNLCSSEKRKAMEYVNNFNGTRELQYYCTNEELSAHIFIGNKFKEDQMGQMKAHFEKYILSNRTTKAVFVNVEGLIQMYNWYRKNYEGVQKHRDVFYEEMHKILTIEERLIQFGDWQKLIQEMESCFRYSIPMDTKRVKETLLS